MRSETGRMKKLLGVIFFEKKLQLQPDVVFDSESKDCNSSSLAPPGGEKKNYFQYFFSQKDGTSRRGRFFFAQMSL